MRLTEKEYYDFLKIHQSLILYAAQKKKLVATTLSMEAFRENTTAQKMIEYLNCFYENPSILDDFLSKNPSKLNNEQLAVANQFRYFEKGTFFVYKYLKDYTVFIKEEQAYGVLSLSDSFQSFFGGNLPTYVETVLLPYKDKIVYHGIFLGGNMRFGSGYRNSLNEVYKKAKAKYGIITSLPFNGDAIYAQESPSDQLKYFMKTKANREEFEIDIKQLLAKHPTLLPEYYQEWGRIDATYYRKQFKDLGLNKSNYALLQGQIIASAIKVKDLENTIKLLVPAKKRDWVYIFKM